QQQLIGFRPVVESDEEPRRPIGQQQRPKKQALQQIHLRQHVPVSPLPIAELQVQDGQYWQHTEALDSSTEKREPALHYSPPIPGVAQKPRTIDRGIATE